VSHVIVNSDPEVSPKVTSTIPAAMPKKSRLQLPPLDLPSADESLGQRLARLRKQRGYTQVELADQIGIIQSLISDYERDRLRPHAEMIVRFALTLGVSTDEVLGVARPDKSHGVPQGRRILRRLQKIETLPKRDQEALLRTIDAFLSARKAG